MAKIKNFNIKKLRTEEDFGFQKRIEAETALLTVETDKPMVAAYKAALTAFDDALKGSTSNSLSSAVTRADEMADAAWSGLNAQTKAMLGHPVEALRTVAAEASALIAKYGNPTAMAYNEEYGRLHNLLQDLAAFGVEKQKQIYIDAWVTELQTRCDEFAAASQQKAEAAQKSGRFEAEIVPVMVKKKKEMVEFKVDEFPKAGVTVEGIGKLRGAFPVGPEGVEDQIVHTFEPSKVHEADAKQHVQRVTAANASGINDGAAAILLASGEAVEKYGLKPMAKLIGWGQGGVDPKIMGVGPVPACRQAMEKANVTIGDIDLVEANEAFAAQSIAVARELGFDLSKVNVNGGAISIGHPVGASGARIIVTLLHELAKRDGAKKGLATLCIGGGMGVSTIFEKC